MAEASIGAVKEFPEGKPYRVDKGPNAAGESKRATEQETPCMAPLNNNKTQHLSTYMYPQIPQEFPTGYVS